MEPAEQPGSRFKRICVYCGHRNGSNPEYIAAAEQLGAELVRRGIGLVYGGGSSGLMGAVARAVQTGGGEVIGVIPHALMPREISGEPIGEQHVVVDMHQRKAKMAAEADAFIALPGGFGTLEELLEMITWSQLGIHSKPVAVLNTCGFYSQLLAFFDSCTVEGFVRSEHRSLVLAADSAAELLDKLEAYEAQHAGIVPPASWEMAKLGYTEETTKN